MSRPAPSGLAAAVCLVIALTSCSATRGTDVSKAASDGNFSSLDALADALRASVGCERREDGVGGLYTKQGLRCRTKSGTNIVAMYDMTPTSIEKFKTNTIEMGNSRAQLGGSTKTDVVIVQADNWVINTGADKSTAEKISRALGGDVVVVYGAGQAAAAQRQQQQDSDDYLARLPKPQRPELSPKDYPPAPTDTLQGLLVHLGPPVEDDDLAAMDLDDAFLEAIESAGVGVGDGDEHGPDGVTFFYYGPDAEAMAQEVAPVLERLSVPPGSYLLLVEGERTLRKEQLQPHPAAPR